MSNEIAERLTEHLLYETKEWEENTQLENMTSLSRKIINTLDNFNWEYQNSPDATTLMEFIKKETTLTDEFIIVNSIKNILKYRNNNVIIWKAWKEKKNLVNLKIYNYCTTLLKWYANIIENSENNQENIWEVLTDDPNQMKIKFPDNE